MGQHLDCFDPYVIAVTKMRNQMPVNFGQYLLIIGSRDLQQSLWKDRINTTATGSTAPSNSHFRFRLGPEDTQSHVLYTYTL